MAKVERVLKLDGGRTIKVLSKSNFGFSSTYEKWSAERIRRVPTPKLLAIHGTGRCGTKYLRYALARAGVSIDHERTGEDGTSSHFFYADSEWYPMMPWYNGKAHVGERLTDFKFAHEWHVVRSPMRAIPSISKIFPSFEFEFMVDNGVVTLDELRDLSRVQRCALAWIRINEEIERRRPVSAVFKIERIRDEWPGLMERLGVDAKFPADIPPMNKTSGYRRYEPLTKRTMRTTLGDQLYQRVIDLAARYGYV
jgi:hypothetical protein